jgi:two-component sensor histidine kinase/ligand-binding sensor domain-containing protein
MFTFADGLPGREVTCAVQDKNGYMWFGTRNGLCRFDGKKFQVFTKKSAGLSLNHVNQVIYDQNRGIIITYQPKSNGVVEASGLCDVMDIHTLKLKSFDKYYKNCPFKQADIAQFSYSRNTKSLCLYMKPFFHLDFWYYPKAVVWELSNKGTFKRVKQKIVKSITFKSEGKKSSAVIEPYTSSKQIGKKSLLIYQDGMVVVNGLFNWIFVQYSTHEGYLVQHLDLQLNRHYYYVKRSGKTVALGDGSTTFRGMTFGPNVTYYQALDDSLVFRLEPNNSLTLNNYSFGNLPIIDSTDTDLIKKARILGLIRDKLGNRWFYTTEGVMKVTIKRKKFNSHFSMKEVPLGANHSVRGILKFNDQLFGSLYDFVGVKQHNKVDTLNIHSNFSFLKTENTIWFGAFELRAYNLLTKKVEFKKQFETAEIWSMFPFNKKQLFLGGTINIHLYDIATNTAKPLKNSTGIVPQLVYRFFYDSEKQLLAVADNGIFVINNKAEIVDCYSIDAKSKRKKLPFSNINDLFQDKNGTYWFATANDGVYKWNKPDHSFESFGIDNGFLTETVCRIEEDRFGKLWISTDFGLAKFDKSTQRATIYTEVDGIAHNEFNRSSSYKDEQGNLYFGGVDGVTSFNPADFENDENENNFPFRLNAISCYNSKTDLQEDETALFETQKYIQLTDARKNLTLSFILLDLEQRDHLYAYQIEGFSKEWNYTREGTFRLDNLPYGEYTIRIKAQCGNGLWNKTELIIPLYVVKPFYKSWWFLSLLILAVAVLLFIAVKYRIKNLENRNLKLEEKVEIRTAELKSSLDEQMVLLQEVHHRVKNNLQFIAAMLKMQINSIKDEGNQKVLIETSRRINSMSLVHEMLYHKDKLETISVKEYLAELVSKLNELTYQQKTPIQFIIECEELNFDINNCVSIGMITSEVISNAIKHAFEGTDHPVVRISLTKNTAEKSIIYTIEDNGVGLTNSETETNSGLGMRLIDIFSRQMEAEYQMDHSNGLKYTFIIPYFN